MKTLLAVGCSFTNKEYQSREHPEMDCSWPKWPEVLGNRLGYKVVNLGRNGGSNDSILRSAQDYMIENKVDMVCALWTEPFRFNIHDCISMNISMHTSMDVYIYIYMYILIFLFILFPWICRWMCRGYDHGHCHGYMH